MEHIDWKEISAEAINLLKPILSQPNFSKEALMSKSEVAAYLCDVIIRLVELHKVWKLIQTYCPDDGSALTKDTAEPLPDNIEESNE